MKTFIVTTLLASLSQAAMVRINCVPVPFKNSASINTTVDISDEVVDGKYLKAAATFNASLKQQISGSLSFPVSGSLSGQVAQAQLSDAKGNPQILKTFYAHSNDGDALRVQLAVGANTGIAANSFIQAKDGAYYFAKCNAVAE